MDALDGLSSPPSQELRSMSDLDKWRWDPTHPLRPYNTTTQRLHSCSLAAHTPTITDRPHPVVVSLSTIASFAMEDLRRKPVR
ncbi:hypothetical protein BD309DRAFT_995023 [Dichomitus squalens]|nr:hypothetical protein BD309DRAFT_995023 [Dichomitus squalens]